MCSFVKAYLASCSLLVVRIFEASWMFQPPLYAHALPVIRINCARTGCAHVITRSFYPVASWMFQPPLYAHALPVIRINCARTGCAHVITRSFYPYQARIKLTRVQRSSFVIIARARRERPGDEASKLPRGARVLEIVQASVSASVGEVKCRRSFANYVNGSKDSAAQHHGLLDLIEQGRSRVGSSRDT